MNFEFTPWKRLEVKVDQVVLRRYLRTVGNESVKAFKKGVDSKKSGRIYYRPGGGRYRASVPGEYPSKPTGRHRATIRSEVDGVQKVTVGSSMFYAKFLREGTKKMKRRKMSDNALKEGIARSRESLRGWIKWTRS